MVQEAYKGERLDRERIQALVIGSEVVRTYEPEDPEVARESKENAEHQYLVAKGNLDWVGMMYLTEMLLDEIADDLEISRGEGQGEDWAELLAQRVRALSRIYDKDAMDDVARALVPDRLSREDYEQLTAYLSKETYHAANPQKER
jgi:hypothetical protein